MPIDLVVPHGQLSEENWKESKDVLRSLHRSLTMDFASMWMTWHPTILNLLDDTGKYTDETEDFDLSLRLSWRKLAKLSINKWDELVNSKSILAEDMDLLDSVEQDLLMEDDDCILREDMSLHAEDRDDSELELDLG